jgi:hypothetical protein
MEIKLHSLIYNLFHLCLFYVATISKFAEICSMSHFQDYSPYKFWAFTQICLILDLLSQVVDVLRWRAVNFVLDIAPKKVMTRRQISLFSTRKVIFVFVD